MDVFARFPWTATKPADELEIFDEYVCRKMGLIMISLNSNIIFIIFGTEKVLKKRTTIFTLKNTKNGLV